MNYLFLNTWYLAPASGMFSIWGPFFDHYLVGSLASYTPPPPHDQVSLHVCDVVSIKVKGVWGAFFFFFHLKLKRRQQDLAGKRPRNSTEDAEDDFEDRSPSTCRLGTCPTNV